jgi:glycosyltransferase involved in cell wall biosynthesis
MGLIGGTAPRTVLVVQRRLTHYRVAFFEALRAEMDTRGLRLIVAHGQPTRKEESKQDAGQLTWAATLPTTYVGDAICWQPFGALARASDLMVVTHENKLLYNLVAQYAYRRQRVALWGHGANLQGDAASLRERFKRTTARRADWWFAYTDATLPHLAHAGFPRDRTTVLHNAVDTTALQADLDALGRADLEGIREELGLRGRRVGIFIGSLHADKRIGFLLESALRVRDRVPDFELVVAGAGPDVEIVRAFCARHPWAKYAGVRTGRRKAELLAVGAVMLNPGLVGLGILDAFVGGVPMVTTDCHLHSPEIAYLAHDANGVMTENDISAFADGVVRVLEKPSYRAELLAGCREAATEYTVERMAKNFAEGAQRCMQSPVSRTSA